MNYFKDKHNCLIICSYLIVLLSFYFFELNNYNTVILYIINFSACFFLCIIFFLRNRNKTEFPFVVILFIALLMRIILIPASPVTSDDYYRYLWDGKVQSEGMNPYEFPPAELKNMQDSILYPHITYPEIKTIYPPLAQIVFLLSFKISGFNFWGLKIFYLIFETAILFFLFNILKLLNTNTNYIFLYVLSPLVIFEFFINLHIDIALILFFTGSIYFALKKNLNISFLFLGFSVLSKIYTLIFLPVYILYFINLNIQYKKIYSGIFCFLLSFLLIAPYQNYIAGLFSALQNYMRHWYFNNLFYVIFKYFGDIAGYFGRGVARLILILFFVIAYIYILKSGFPFVIQLFLVSFFYLFLSPTVHPWYVSLLVMFLPFCFSYSALFWSGVLGFVNITVYFYLKNNKWEDFIPVLITEYIMLAVLIFFDIKNFRKIVQLQKSLSLTK